MAYNEFLADRIRQMLQLNRISFFEREMMGGLTFMDDDLDFWIEKALEYNPQAKSSKK